MDYSISSIEKSFTSQLLPLLRREFIQNTVIKCLFQVTWSLSGFDCTAKKNDSVLLMKLLKVIARLVYTAVIGMYT